MTNVLKRYYRVFFAEQYSYILDRPIDDVLAEVRDVLTREKPFMSVPNITGRMTKYTFEATPLWSFLIIKGDNRNAYLKGELVPHNITSTRIDLSARPNSVFFIFHIAFTAIAGISPVVVPGGNVPETIACGVAFILAGTIPPWFGAYLCKKFLRETFEDAMGVKPIATPHT